MGKAAAVHPSGFIFYLRLLSVSQVFLISNPEIQIQIVILIYIKEIAGLIILGFPAFPEERELFLGGSS